MGHQYFDLKFEIRRCYLATTTNNDGIDILLFIGMVDFIGSVIQ